MNRSDSEKIATQLEMAGHKPAKTLAAADLVVINFCSIRQGAVHRAMDQLQKLGQKKIIAAGCLLPVDKKRLEAKGITVWHPDDYFFQAPLRENKFSAFVPIMTGCNNFCSYCAVPYTRGREKSRPAAKIIKEIKLLIAKGAKEIILLGQNVNSYRDKKIDFPALLKKINGLSGNFWLSFISSHPKDMSDKLITALAQSKKITPYIHLPVQSGDNKILHAMNRRYNIAHYKNLIKKLHAAFKKYRADFPPLAITTDIIVGFPGETEKQFQNTLKLIQAIEFDMIYFARYSPRSGTPAAKLKDSVPPNEKRRRAQAINSLLKQQALSINKKYLNQEIGVLIEKIDGAFAFGKTLTNKAIRLPKQKLKAGQIIKAIITDAGPWSFKGLEKPR